MQEKRNIYSMNLCKFFQILQVLERICKGVSLPIIQHILGHQSIKTTQVYSAVKDTTINKEIRRAFR